MYFKTFFAASAVLAMAAPAGAETVAAKDPPSVAAALQAAGFQAKLDKDKGGDPMITSGSSGSRFGVYFYNCTDNRDCATVQFHASYDAEAGKAPSLEKINEWNRKQRFGRAYLDSEGDPAVEMDVDLDDGGMSRELFTDNVEFWTTIMAEFEKHIGW